MPNVIMPKMGDGMEEGTLLRWLKQVGDEVAVGRPDGRDRDRQGHARDRGRGRGTLTQLIADEGQEYPWARP